MGAIESFPTKDSLIEFLTDKKARYRDCFSQWLTDYTADNRLFIASEDRVLSSEEISEYISDL